MGEQAQLLPGTLDLLILKAVSLGPLHGYGVLRRIEQISGTCAARRAGRALPGARRTTGAVMKLLAYVRSVAARFFDRSRVEDELDQELRSHSALRADDLERAGLIRADAERRARVEFAGAIRSCSAVRFW